MDNDNYIGEYDYFDDIGLDISHFIDESSIMFVEYFFNIEEGWNSHFAAIMEITHSIVDIEKIETYVSHVMSLGEDLFEKDWSKLPPHKLKLEVN